MTQHTVEPWEARCLLVKGGERLLDTITHCGGNLHPVARRASEAEANARRIVACVNALAGIPTEAIEALPEGELARLIRERVVLKEGV